MKNKLFYLSIFVALVFFAGVRLTNKIQLYDQTRAEYSIIQRSLTGLTIDSGTGGELSLKVADTEFINCSDKIYLKKNIDCDSKLIQNISGISTSLITSSGNLYGDLIGNVTGNVTGNVSGSAGTVTNGVYTTDFPLNQNTTGQAGTVATINGLAPNTQNTFSRTQYLIPYADSTTSWGQIPIGSDGQVLTSNGAGSVASFQTVGSSTPTGDMVVKGWANLNCTGTISIRDSYNVSSITDSSTGIVYIYWDTDFANTNYCCIPSGGDGIAIDGYINQTTTTFAEVRTINNSGTYADSTQVHVIAIGDQ